MKEIIYTRADMIAYALYSMYNYPVMSPEMWYLKIKDKQIEANEED